MLDFVRLGITRLLVVLSVLALRKRFLSTNGMYPPSRPDKMFMPSLSSSVPIVKVTTWSNLSTIDVVGDDVGSDDGDTDEGGGDGKCAATSTSCASDMLMEVFIVGVFRSRAII